MASSQPAEAPEGNSSFTPMSAFGAASGSASAAESHLSLTAVLSDLLPTLMVAEPVLAGAGDGAGQQPQTSSSMNGYPTPTLRGGSFSSAPGSTEMAPLGGGGRERRLSTLNIQSDMPPSAASFIDASGLPVTPGGGGLPSMPQSLRIRRRASSSLSGVLGSTPTLNRVSSFLSPTGGAFYVSGGQADGSASGNPFAQAQRQFSNDSAATWESLSSLPSAGSDGGGGGGGLDFATGLASEGASAVAATMAAAGLLAGAFTSPGTPRTLAARTRSFVGVPSATLARRMTGGAEVQPGGSASGGPTYIRSRLNSVVGILASSVNSGHRGSEAGLDASNAFAAAAAAAAAAVAAEQASAPSSTEYSPPRVVGRPSGRYYLPASPASTAPPPPTPAGAQDAQPPSHGPGEPCNGGPTCCPGGAASGIALGGTRRRNSLPQLAGLPPPPAGPVGGPGLPLPPGSLIAPPELPASPNPSPSLSTTGGAAASTGSEGLGSSAFGFFPPPQSPPAPLTGSSINPPTPFPPSSRRGSGGRSSRNASMDGDDDSSGLSQADIETGSVVFSGLAGEALHGGGGGGGGVDYGAGIPLAPSDIAEAALLGLIRVANRFQALFEEQASARLAAVQAEGAGAGDAGGATGVSADEAAAYDGPCQITVSRQDIELITGLVDVMFVAWNSGASGPAFVAPAGGVAGNTVVLGGAGAGSSRAGSGVGASASGTSGSPPLTPFGEDGSSGGGAGALPAAGGSSGTELITPARGSLLARRLSAGVSGGIGNGVVPALPLATLGSPSAAPTTVVTEAVPAAEGGQAAPADAVEPAEGSGDASGAVAAAAAAGTASSGAAGAATPAQPVTSRRRNSRTIAKEELRKTFEENPAIFDESTRQYVASLVTPRSHRPPLSARERLRAAGQKVALLTAATRAWGPGGAARSPTAGDAASSGRLLKKTPSQDPRSAASAAATTGTASNRASTADPLASRAPAAEAAALVGLEDWGFDIIGANTTLLKEMGLIKGEEKVATDADATSPFSHDAVGAVVAAVEGAGGVSTSAAAAATALIPLPVPGKGVPYAPIPDSGAGTGAEMLVALTSSALERTGVVADLGLDRGVLTSFLARIARGYRAQPYHNALHGADVTQAMLHLMTQGGLGRHLSPELRFASLLAAAVHDVGHVGTNNVFLTQSQHPLALAYNDRSPLENMHAATLFLALRHPGCDVLAPLSPDARSEFRGLVIDMILATDNSTHFKLMAKLERRVRRAYRAVTAGGEGGAGSNGARPPLPSPAEDDDDDEDDEDDELASPPPAAAAAHPASSPEEAAITAPLDLSKPKDAHLVLQAVLHACDIGNPAREWEVYGHWTDRIMEEFLHQGDLMRSAGISPIPPMHDRATAPPRANMQAGFIAVLVMPLWRQLAHPVFKRVLDVDTPLKGLEANLGRYKAIVDAAKAAATAPAPAPAPAPAAEGGADTDK